MPLVRKALALATKLCEKTQYRSVQALDTLAAACAEVGDFESAVRHLETALDLPDAQGPDAEKTRNTLLARLRRYRTNQPILDDSRRGGEP